MLLKLENLLQSEIDPVFAKRARFIFHSIEKKRPKKILDAGCGRGFYLQALTLYDFPKEIVGVDINDAYLVKAKAACKDKRVRIQKSDIYKLPFHDNYFDMIICSEILEHLPDDKKGLLEIKRVLKPGGALLVTVPNANFPFLWDPLNWVLMRLFDTHINKNVWWLAGMWADHERLYTKKEIESLVASCFKIERLKLFGRHSWPFSHFILYGIGKNIVERLGTGSVNRFNLRRDDRPLARFLASIFSLPSRLFDSDNEKEISVDIGISAGK
jgi:ubiquinone/menaquinone biosynthesis C-methylase UbiE